MSVGGTLAPDATFTTGDRAMSHDAATDLTKFTVATKYGTLDVTVLDPTPRDYRTGRVEPRTTEGPLFRLDGVLTVNGLRVLVARTYREGRAYDRQTGEYTDVRTAYFDGGDVSRLKGDGTDLQLRGYNDATDNVKAKVNQLAAEEVYPRITPAQRLAARMDALIAASNRQWREAERLEQEAEEARQRGRALYDEAEALSREMRALAQD